MMIEQAEQISSGAEPAPERSGAELVIRAVEAEGTEYIFGYPGGAIMPIYDALFDSHLKHILARHEQGAIFSADAYARVSGKVGVCMATSGPGATNLVTGLANAFMDSVPIVAITGQVASHLMGTDAFQEVDIFGMTLPVVKHSFVIRRVEDIPHVIAEAFHIARSGRPGPVLVDIPKDVTQTRTFEPRTFVPDDPTPPCPANGNKAAAEWMIAQAKRPLLYVGGGVVLGGAVQALRDFVERTGLPSVATLKGLGTLPTDHPLTLGMLGMHGTKAANMAVHDCDVLIAVGARFDDRATGHLDSFAPNAKIIHMDRDPAEVGKLRRPDVALVGELKDILNGLYPGDPDMERWTEYLSLLKMRHGFRYDAPGDGIYAPGMLKELSEKAGDDFIAACDVGQHQMWVAQHCRFARPQAHLTSGGLGAMGYGLPAGIGALLAEPNANVVTVSGDGSFMMNVQELATVQRYKLPLKILLLDNSTLGLVRQWQELFFDSRFSEVDLSCNPDFAEVADAFGMEAFTVTKREEQSAAVDRLLNTKGPILAHVKIDPKANVWPLVPPGKSNIEMLEG